MFLGLAVLGFLTLGVSAQAADATTKQPTSYKTLSTESDDSCVDCHMKKNPGLHKEWVNSKHFKANVGCYECHKAEPGAIDAYNHKDAVITTIVTPKRCATCHEREVKEFDASHHATGGLIINSLDNTLAEVVEGSLQAKMTLNGESPVSVQGCWQCHGSLVKVLADGKLDPATWPNTGMVGSIPMAARGPCTACHQRHLFSKAEARQPEVCGKCHLGPDHPQKGDLQVQAWHCLSRRRCRRDEFGLQQMGGRSGLHGGAHLRDLPYVGDQNASCYP